MTSAMARASPCGTRKPVSPSRTDSRMPGEFEATTGVAQAAASRLVIPHPSLGDANAKRPRAAQQRQLLLLADTPKKPHPRTEVKRRRKRSSSAR